MKMKKSRAITLTVVAVLLAAYILFPFFLVVLNSFKTQAAIVQNPISAAGASFKQFSTNLSSVINNKNFVFWRAFGSSAIVTVISLVLLGRVGHLPQQDQVVHRHLHGVHLLHDHPLPGGYAPADRHLP